jgi:hypothetical protein
MYVTYHTNTRGVGLEEYRTRHIPPHRYVTESPSAAEARADEAAEVDALGTAPEAEELIFIFIFTIWKSAASLRLLTRSTTNARKRISFCASGLLFSNCNSKLGYLKTSKNTRHEASRCFHRYCHGHRSPRSLIVLSSPSRSSYVSTAVPSLVPSQLSLAQQIEVVRLVCAYVILMLTFIFISPYFRRSRNPCVAFRSSERN